VTEGGSVRRYSSPLREENARRTRQAIIAAAHQLFTERGYGATSLADIAAAAGVARPTPSAVFGSKPALLKEVLDQALAGDDEPVPVAQRPWFRPASWLSCQLRRGPLRKTVGNQWADAGYADVY
jgi:AcrR family transcriptional regulator